MSFDHITDDELRNDRLETLGDITLCKRALASEITHYGDHDSVKQRLLINRRILERIDTIMAERGVDC